MIEEKTRTGKSPPQNELELKVFRLVVFLQSKLNQVEGFCRQAQSIFQEVDCAIWETQWLQYIVVRSIQYQLPVIRPQDADVFSKKRQDLDQLLVEKCRVQEVLSH